MARILTENWRQELAQGDKKTRLALLPRIELGARQQPLAYMALLPLAQEEDFALRLRALIALGRLGQEQAFEALLPLLARERENHWRLAMLDTLLQLPLADKISPLLPFLAQDQPEDGDGYFLAGLIWFFGQQGLAAIEPLTQQVLARPARARRIKDSLLAEAFWLAAQGDSGLLEALAQNSPPLYRFCTSRVWPADKRAHFSIYPNPDYLLEKAQLHAMSKAEYKQLFFWHRAKNSPAE